MGFAALDHAAKPPRCRESCQADRQGADGAPDAPAAGTDAQLTIFIVAPGPTRAVGAQGDRVRRARGDGRDAVQVPGSHGHRGRRPLRPSAAELLLQGRSLLWQVVPPAWCGRCSFAPRHARSARLGCGSERCLHRQRHNLPGQLPCLLAICNSNSGHWARPSAPREERDGAT